MFEFSGIFAPIATPFTDDGNQLSEVRLARMIQRLVESGVPGIVVNTDIGEFTSTSFGERKAVLEFAVRETRNAVPIFAHATTLNTSASLDLAQHAERHGARGIVIMPPYYGDLNTTELIHHFRIIARYCGLPIIIVDPQQKMTEPVRQGLVDGGNFLFADRIAGVPTCESGLRTQEWMVDGIRCSPAAALFGDVTTLSERVLGQWATLMRELGSLRVVKAAFAAQDLPIGESRAPYLGLTAEQLGVINALVRLTEQEKAAEGTSAA